MPTINQLSQLNVLSGADQIPVYSASNGDARKASLTTLLDYFEATFASPEYVTQYASPNVNGFVVNVASTTQSTWLLLTPTMSLATGTIVLPAAASIPDGLELLVYSSQTVDALTLSLNGAAAVNGAPSGIYAGGSFIVRFDKLSNAWWTVQSAASYAQGTWTPTLVGGVVVGTVSYTGRWTRVGRQVTVELLVQAAGGSSLAFAPGDYWSGLPSTLFPWTSPNCGASGPANASFPGVGLVVLDTTPAPTGKLVTLSNNANFLALSRTLFTATYTI